MMNYLGLFYATHTKEIELIVMYDDRFPPGKHADRHACVHVTQCYWY